MVLGGASLLRFLRAVVAIFGNGARSLRSPQLRCLVDHDHHGAESEHRMFPGLSGRLGGFCRAGVFTFLSLRGRIGLKVFLTLAGTFVTRDELAGDCAVEQVDGQLLSAASKLCSQPEATWNRAWLVLCLFGTMVALFVSAGEIQFQ